MWFGILFVFTFLSIHQIKCHEANKDASALGNETNCINDSIQLYEEEVLLLTGNCSWLNNTYLTKTKFQISIKDNKIALSVDPRLAKNVNSSDIDDLIAVKGRFLGRTEAQIHYNDSNHISRFVQMKITVIRRERIIDHLFVAGVTLLMMLAYVGMGCEVDLGAVKEVLRKPVAPVIGFMTQYVIMPLTAFAVIKLFGLTGGIALGFFASGCSPGGGASNMYTFMLGGDSSLSVTMTLISTIASLGMFPLWLHTLGRLVYDTHGAPLKVPFTNIFTSLAVMIIPLAIGAAIKIRRPQWAGRIRKIMRPFFATIILLLICLGTWSNLYLFQLISPWLILGACLLSYTGFLLGGLTAFLCRLGWSRVIAVAVETGVQNTGLPILLLKFSLSQPDADLSVVSPVTVALLMPIPLWVAITILEIRKRCKGSSQLIQIPTSDSEVKILKSPEANGIHFVEVGGDGEKPNTKDLDEPDPVDTSVPNGFMRKPLQIPNGSGDFENERF